MTFTNYNDTTNTSINLPAMAFPNVCMGPLLHPSSDANSRLNKLGICAGNKNNNNDNEEEDSTEVSKEG